MDRVSNGCGKLGAAVNRARALDAAWWIAIPAVVMGGFLIGSCLVGCGGETDDRAGTACRVGSDVTICGSTEVLVFSPVDDAGTSRGSTCAAVGCPLGYSCAVRDPAGVYNYGVCE